MLTDGLLTTGSPMSSIADGEFAGTAIFAVGFGTGADVDYATLQGLVDKGRTLPTQQVFHGENAGTIDKFYSNALAKAIGFTTVFDRCWSCSPVSTSISTSTSRRPTTRSS